MDLGLHDKIALVAAASRGLGKAVARRLAEEGARVAICARDQKALERTAEEIRAQTGSEVLPVAADLTRAEDVTGFVEAAVARFGGLDALVTNAGGPPAGTFFDFDDGAWEEAFRLTLMSVVRLCRAVIPHMKRRGGGRIVHITSVSVKQPVENLILSNSLRLAVVGLSKSLANELGPEGITVNCVCPGYTATRRLEELFRQTAERAGVSLDRVVEDLVGQVPLRRLGQPEELADLVAILCSDRAGYLTGAAIPVDGGMVKGVY